MRLLIVTPLYPPDTNRLAWYTKALASKLVLTHEVSIMTYGNIPEDICRVTILSVPKRLPLILRFIFFTIRLSWLTRKYDILLVCDGASVGLPTVFAHWLHGTPIVRLVMDEEIWIRTRNLSIITKQLNLRLRLIRWLQGFVLHHAQSIIVASNQLGDFFIKADQQLQTKTQVSNYPLEPLAKLPFPTLREPMQIICDTTWADPIKIDIVFKTFELLKTVLPSVHLVTINAHDKSTNLDSVSPAERDYLLDSSALFISMNSEPYQQQELMRAYRSMIPILIITDSTTPQELAHEISCILQNNSKRRELIERGLTYFKSEVDWDQHLVKLESIFASISE